ncbi:MAG TPA: isoprenylcysteine carboxylmethyltransferase family protein [Gemmatimonadales bacterium]|nr:isoprenylcysteine carboxylmethyltransferase family protein [Gemmatimonadales bacterium]
MITTVRHFLGVLLVVTLPPALAYWFVIHPFAHRWRRLDVRVTYSIVILLMIGLGSLLFITRATLLGRDLGTNWLLIGAGAVLYLGAVALTLRVRRQLTFQTFAGVPEVSGTAAPGQLLQDGIYGVIRHPRYLSVILGTAAMALIVNYAGVYLVVLAGLLGLAPLIRLEERELAARFGAAYTAYRARVPALIPRLPPR